MAKRKLRVLDYLFQGHNLATARKLAGYGSRSCGYRWLFDDPGIRAIANERIRAGGRLAEPAMKALGASPDAELHALLLEIQADIREWAAAARELSWRIDVLLPEDVLIERARVMSRGDTVTGSMLGWALREAGKRFNPVNVSTLRHLVNGAEREVAAND